MPVQFKSERSCSSTGICNSKKPVTKVIKESPEEKQIHEEFYIDEIKK
jgi:hypothetical protein